MNGERTGGQLALIAQTPAAARLQGIPLWLRGGRAMDFFLGEVTREHGDIDWFARARDAAPLAERPAPDLQLDFVRGALSSSFTLVDRDTAVGISVGHEGLSCSGRTSWSTPKQEGLHLFKIPRQTPGSSVHNLAGRNC